MTHPNINNLDDYKLLNMQNYLLFAVGAAAVNAGLLFPKIPALTDTLIIFSIALSIAVISISLCSSKTSELKNFPLPAIAAVAVSILSFLASVKLILIGNTAGPVIKLISRLDIVTELVPNYLSVLFFAAVSVTLMFLTIKFTRTLSKNIKNHIEEIKIIEQTRQESPIKEKRFFYGVYAFGRFSFWLAITCFAAVALSFFIASLAGKTTISLVAATGILMQSIMLFTVLAVANLTHRLGAKFSQQYKMTEEQFQEQIKVDTISEEKVDALTFIIHKSKSLSEARRITEKLKKLIPRQNFEVKIQAAIGAKIIASERLSPFRKDVTSGLYGGDVTRKNKLLDKQKKGKKKMKSIGRVEVPTDVFIKVLRNK